MALGRSPNYPRLTLEDSLEKIKEVYSRQHIYTTDKEVLAKNLGYGGINGGSQSMIAALLSYGLITKVGNDFKVSEEVVTILELPEDSLPRIETIKLLATIPDIFAELEQAYPEKLPQNELIRHFLIKKKFLPKAADEVIRIYRANLEFVNELDNKYNKGTVSEKPEHKDNAKMQQTVSIPEVKPPAPVASNNAVDDWGSDVLSFNISRTGKAQVRFNGQITQEAIKKLIAHLDLSLDTYPTQSELEQSKFTSWKNNDYDQPVSVTGELGEKNGKKFYLVEESQTGISEDELDFRQNRE